MHSLAAIRGNEAIRELEAMLPELKENNFQVIYIDKENKFKFKKGRGDKQRIKPVYLDKLKPRNRSNATRKGDEVFEKEFIDKKKDNPLFKNLIRNLNYDS